MFLFSLKPEHSLRLHLQVMNSINNGTNFNFKELPCHPRSQDKDLSEIEMLTWKKIITIGPDSWKEREAFGSIV